MIDLQTLPNDTELESMALSGLLWLNNDDVARQIVTQTPEDAFFKSCNTGLWRIIERLVDNKSLDTVSFLSEVQNKSNALYHEATLLLSNHAEFTTQSVQKWFCTLRDLAHKRKVITMAYTMIEDAQNPHKTPVEIEERMAQSRIENLSRYSVELPLSVKEACDKFDNFREFIRSDKKTAVATGIQELDNHGLMIPEYNVILARSSVGKTAFMLSCVRNQIFAGKHVLLWSGEQEIEMIIAKLISLITRYSIGKILWQEPSTKEEQDNIAFVRDNLRNLPLHLLDGQRGLASIWSHAASLKEAGKLDVVWLDQFDKIKVEGQTKYNKEQTLGRLSADIFAMKKALNVPVNVLAQLGLKTQATHPKPSMWHIRDCSQVIQDVDRAYVLDRPESEPERLERIQKEQDKLRKGGNHQDAEDMDVEGKIFISLEKNRNGLGGLWREGIGFDKGCGEVYSMREKN